MGVLVFLAACSLSDANARDIELATATFPPFRQVVGGALSGADYDIVTEVLNRMGYQYTVKLFPFQRALKLAESAQGPVGFFALTRNADRESRFLFSSPISTVRDVFFKRSPERITWTSYADLSAYVVGISEGYNYAPEFMRAIQERRFKTMAAAGDSPELEQLRRLSRGVVDVAICRA